ncbi:HECT-like ubiquitin-conjugating enzyme-binding-domain-containing protein [Boletus edulis]|nr:HECT-like ubiquitin-conjugating enzyme-binding-domain-containing protein [Boletus edulis]
MATLVRPRLVEHDATDLHMHIPTPFPLQQLIDLQADVLDDLAAEPMDYADSRVAQCQNDIQASVTAVHHTCLMTLANILSLSSPITGPANDSEHPNDPNIPLTQVLAESPLSCLVHALRARCGYPHTVDHPPSEAALLSQLHDLVDAIVPSLRRQDAHPAQAIVALLLDLEQLPASLALTSAQLVSQTDPSQHSENGSGPPPPPTSPYATIASLQRQLSSLQPAVASTSSGSRPTPAESVQSALLWARIDEQLEIVVALCRARASSLPQRGMTEPSPFGLVIHPSESHNSNNDRPSFDDALPPYDSDCHRYSNDRPPSYIAEGYPFASSTGQLNDEKSSLEQYPPEKVSFRVSTSTFPADTGMTTEHDHAMSSNSLDLDAITHAIERLYVVAPQLANQRVELRREKLVQMEKAKQGKGKARTLADIADPELDKMLDLLGRASAREIPDQSVVIDPYRTARGVGAADIEEQRRKYLEHLVHRTSAGRLHSQDAVPSLGRSSPSSTGGASQDRAEDQSSEKEPEGRSSRDGKRASYPSEPKSGSTLEPPPDRLRNRSLSAPHLAWLRPKEKTGSANGTKEGFGSITRTLSSDPKSLPPSATSKSVRSFSGRLRGVSKTRPSSAGGDGVSLGALDIAYVAEHHETLKHVLLFIACISPSSSLLGGVPLAEVLPSTSSGTHGDCLFLRLGGTPSPPLALPVPVVPGSKSVLSRGGHWEVKASCYQSGVVPKDSEDAALLPASELASLSPSLYVCSSCSLPLVPAPPTRYRDLPSEHWEELIDSWMCHPEGQTLAKTGMHGDDSNGKASGFGFWPTRDEALVGGSYVLFDAQAVAGGNIKCVGVRERDGHSHLARCLCGAAVGRQHDRRQEDSSVSRMYRLFKYAIRPISTTSQVPKIPMSAFVLHDMLEHVQAHATYRFVLSDEEDERPRLLIWLFKPRIRISYMLAAPALLPKSGTLDGSKVLYKILGPSTSSDLKDILNKYPGFPQAEYLFYPMDVCRKLAALLKESTASYPEGMQTMTGLDVGWLVMA